MMLTARQPSVRRETPKTKAGERRRRMQEGRVARVSCVWSASSPADWVKEAHPDVCPWWQIVEKVVSTAPKPLSQGSHCKVIGSEQIRFA